MDTKCNYIKNNYIKNDCKAKLNKNWVPLIMAWITAGFLFGILLYFSYLCETVWNRLIVFNESSELVQTIASLVIVLAFILLFLLTIPPILMGIKKYNLSIMKRQPTNLIDIFYYFNKSEYGKVIFFNIRLYLRKILLAAVAMIPMMIYVFAVTALEKLGGSTAISLYNSYDKYIMPFNNLIYLVFIILGVCFYFALSRKYILAPYYYALELNDRKHIIKQSTISYKANKTTINKLSHSMFFLYMLSFTVVAIMYTIPYMQSIYANMAYQLVYNNEQHQI